MVKKHVIAGSRMVARWGCDGHGKDHEASKWGYFAMPLMSPDGGKTVKIYCRKTINLLEEEIEKADAAAKEANDASPKAEQPQVVAPPTGLLEVSGGEVRPVAQEISLGGTEAPVRSVQETDGVQPVVSRPPPAFEPRRIEPA